MFSTCLNAKNFMAFWDCILNAKNFMAFWDCIFRKEEKKYLAGNPLYP